jgi:type VI secretion system protein ImpL
MKKITPMIIILWIVLFVLGLGIGLTGILTPAPDVLMWLLATLFWVGDLVWILIFLLTKKKKTPKGASFVGNQSAFNRILHETEEAVARYTDAVNRKGLLKKSALYERPWFLLCGTSKSGKSSLIKGSGLNFPLRYPSERDGLIVDGSNQNMWYFANEAVWIDTPGIHMDDAGKDDWQALIAALKKVRPETPVDGVALVVNTNEVLNTDDQGIKDLAKRLRSRIDELISLLGIEFPVYLLFNRTDEVPGFNEYFSDQLERGQDQIFGATISTKAQANMPRITFAEEFGLLCKSLTDLRLDKLYKERSESRKRMICRFVIHFEGIQQKLGALVAELFKPSSYEGKPIFRGFYFTSCYEKLPDIEHASPSAVSSKTDLSLTILNHPLNPNKAFRSGSAGSDAPAMPKQSSRKNIKSIFVLPLFRDIMVKDKSLVKTTQKRSRQEMIRHYSIIGIIALAGILTTSYFFSTYHKASIFLKSISEDLASMPKDDAPLMEQYAAMEVARQSLAKLQKYEDHGTPITMGIGFYQGKKIIAELKKTYFYRLKRYIISPSVKYLEYEISGKINSYGELVGNDYDNLYRSLKAYLLLSEAIPKDSKEIDTTFLRPVLLDAIKQSILATVNTSRLPKQIETILNDNTGLFLKYYRRGEFERIQENQSIVQMARKKLSRLPSPTALYEAVINKIITDPQVPSLTLDQLLKRQGEGILKSNYTVSAAYTQDGWSQFVSEAITEAAKNPFKVDWVIGLTEGDVPEDMLDKKALRNEMVKAYLLDCKQQWLGLLASLDMEPFGDLQRGSRMIQKLGSDNSELVTLLESISTYSFLKDESDAEKAGSQALNMASKMKATKGIAKKISTAEKKYEFNFSGKTPIDEFNASFDFLRTFARSTSGGLSGFQGYKDKLLTLAEKINIIETQGEAQAVIVFNGKDEDPLLSGWKYTQNELTRMPEEISASMNKVLIKPYEYIGSAASLVLTKTLNTKWQNEIVKPFTNRFSGRFPFSTKGEDASFNDVMDFFRPVTGTYWSFYERVLSAYVSKGPNGWGMKTLGSVQLNFNSELSKSLSSAERIRDIFFKQDGTLRALDIMVTPSSSNKNKARIQVNNQLAEIIPGGRSSSIRWPEETNTSAALKIQVSGNATEDINANGAWGLMKLIQLGKVNKTNSSTFSAKWQVNVQNMYMVYIEAKFQISGTDHPFGDQIFQAFVCPSELLLEIKK